MKTFLLSIVIAVGLVGCAANPNVTTPSGKAAQAALEISTRVGELQNAAIAANTNGSLSDRDSVTVVKFTVAAQQTLKDVPNGWQVTLKTSYQAMKDALDASVKTKLAVALTTLDALIGAL
jgi:hypothetical protein